MDIKILTKAFPGENNAFDAIAEGAMLDISQYPPGIYVSERYTPPGPDRVYVGLNSFDMHIVDNNGRVRTLYGDGNINAHVTKINKQGVPESRIAKVGIDEGKLFVILPESGPDGGLYETYVATTTDEPKLTKQEYANQITQLYRILRTI